MTGPAPQGRQVEGAGAALHDGQSYKYMWHPSGGRCRVCRGRGREYSGIGASMDSPGKQKCWPCRNYPLDPLKLRLSSSKDTSADRMSHGDKRSVYLLLLPVCQGFLGVTKKKANNHAIVNRPSQRKLSSCQPTPGRTADSITRVEDVPVWNASVLNRTDVAQMPDMGALRQSLTGEHKSF